jgi:nanoRNase/pAp phosphatase (c-di-AMP/oligoRNAs hydrolase)
MSSINKEKMDEIFSGLEKDSIVGILVHPSPDPDCLGSAAGMAVLVKEAYGLNSKIFHYGEVSHPQNKSLKNILHISLEDGNDFDPKNVAATIVVDTDLENTGFKSNDLKKVDLRLDHHSMSRGTGAKLSDIRPIGATCSIVWDYLQTFGVSFTSPNTSEIDMEAFRGLLPFVDRISLATVTKYPLPKVVFEIEAKAYKDKELRNTTLVSFVGEVTAHNRDIIPTIADRFARMDGVSNAIILGVIDNHIIASVRSDDARVDVNDLCVRAFGKSHAGGKEGSGGARFPLGAAYELLDDKDTKEKVKSEVVSQLKKKIFEELGEHKEES